MFSQIPTPSPGQIENWLLPAAAVASMALLAKKLFSKKVGSGSPIGPSPDFITRAELHQGLTGVRDKIDARFLALSEKLEHLHDRLARIEATLARLDERTSNHSAS